MEKSKQIMIAVSLASACLSASAADWKFAAGDWDPEDSSSYLFEIDMDTLGTKAGLKTTWIRMSSVKPADASGTYPPKQFKSTISLYVTDCAAKEQSIQRTIRYENPFGMGDQIGDELSQTFENARKFLKSPIPGTYGETLLKKICQMKFK